MKDSKKEDKEA